MFSGMSLISQKIGVKKNNTLITIVMIYLISGKNSEIEDVSQVMPVRRKTVAKR
jgi:hypothetical protein